MLRIQRERPVSSANAAIPKYFGFIQQVIDFLLGYQERESSLVLAEGEKSTE